MRNNQPVTQLEHKMNTGDILVSRTDLKGRIVYANKAFCDIAGFTMDELQGQAHNIVRHPDMPISAFQDLWETIAAKRPWTGMVKNRCKNGDYYWVTANVSPEYDSKGNVSGYISVRTAPTQAQIDSTEALYQDVNAGKASLPSTLKASWFKKITLKTIILTTATTSFITLFAIGSMFISTLNNDKHTSELRLASLPVINAVRNILEFMPQHRGMSNAYLHGKTELASKLSSNEQKIDRLLKSLKDLPQLTQFPQLHNDINAIQQQWSKIKQQWKHASSKESFQRHTTVINNLIALSSNTLHQGEIFGDSALDITYLGQFIAESIPSLNEHMGHLRGLGTGITAKGAITPNQRDAVMELYVKAKTERDDFLATIEHIMHIYSPHLIATLSPPMQQLKDGSATYLSYVKHNLLDAEKITADSNLYFNTGTQAISASLSLYDTMASSLKKLLLEEYKDASTTYYTVITLSLLAMIIYLLLTVFMIHKTFKPLQEIVDGMQRIVEGNYHTQPTKHAADELGDIVDDMKTLQSVLQYEIFEGKATALASAEAQQQAENEKVQIQIALANAFEDNVGSLVSGLANEVKQVSNTAVAMDSLAEDLSAQSDNTLQNVDKGSSQINSTAAAMEEMSITIESVSEEISKTQTISAQAVDEAKTATAMMIELNSVANEIGSIVSAISDIAEQTNLLALNASIEAARAGDAGRGFSVVASEVKELANQTSLATNKIREQVEGIQTESQQASKAIDKISATIKDINTFTAHVVVSMEQQSDAGREISQASQEADMSMGEANHSAVNLAGLASNVAKSSDEMIAVAQSMAQSTDNVQQGIQEFLETLRKH